MERDQSCLKRKKKILKVRATKLRFLISADVFFDFTGKGSYEAKYKMFTTTEYILLDKITLTVAIHRKISLFTNYWKRYRVVVKRVFDREIGCFIFQYGRHFLTSIPVSLMHWIKERLPVRNC